MTYSVTTTRNQELIRGVLSNLTVFAGSVPPQLDALVMQCRTVPARAGEYLARRGERLPGVFAVAYGTVKLSLRGPDHEERVLRIATAGQMFGEAAALLGRDSSYDALALSDSKLIVVPPASIFALIDRDPRLARGMLKALAERNVELLEEVEAATLKRSAQRLASYLDSLAPRSAPSDCCTIRLPVTKTVVAARLGVKKETLSRLLRRFAAEGLIAVSRGDIALLDRGRLAALAS